jgi:hypothetical protein
VVPATRSEQVSLRRWTTAKQLVDRWLADPSCQPEGQEVRLLLAVAKV